MERLTISLTREFAAELTAFMDAHGYANRSEAVRDLARIGLRESKARAGGAGQCVATLSYVYDHRARQLPLRLTETGHAHHDLLLSTLHVHLDHAHCLEVTVLRGEIASVQGFTDAVTAERGVSHGALSLVPVSVERAAHAHGPARPERAHDHSHPGP